MKKKPEADAPGFCCMDVVRPRSATATEQAAADLQQIAEAELTVALLIQHRAEQARHRCRPVAAPPGVPWPRTCPTTAGEALPLLAAKETLCREGHHDRARI
jgi:hypothetical protein